MPELATKHTFGLPARCKKLVAFSSVDMFLDAFDINQPYWILGGGSNTLFLEDYDGTVFINQLRGIEHTTCEHGHILHVAAGENWHDFVSYCLAQGWYGLENLALIPGSVGAAPIQNIGAYGLEVGEYISSVQGIYLNSGEPFHLSAEACEFGYRDSVFKHALAAKVLITSVEFLLPYHAPLRVEYGELKALDSPTPHTIYDTVIAVRQKKLPDPTKTGNAGSFFKNPVISTAHYNALKQQYTSIPGFVVSDSEVKVPAAWLIDQAGLKGKQIGGVQSHTQQPLVLINKDNATGDDVVAMASHIIDTVEARYHIKLEPEVRLVKQHGLITL